MLFYNFVLLLSNVVLFDFNLDNDE